MNNNSGKLYITISDKRGDGGGIPPTPPDGREKDRENDPFGDFAKHQLMHFLQSQVNEAVQFSIGNIGNFTGDYVEQRHQTLALQRVKSVLNIGAIAIAGFKYTGGNPLGALVGAGVAVLGQTLTAGRSLVTEIANNKKQNFEIEQLKIRSGLNTITDGSRGTEN